MAGQIVLPAYFFFPNCMSIVLPVACLCINETSSCLRSSSFVLDPTYLLYDLSLYVIFSSIAQKRKKVVWLGQRTSWKLRP